MNEQQITEAHQLGIPDFLGKNADLASPGNDKVIINWKAEYDRNGLTTVGNVKPKSNTEAINLVVVAFTSPDYSSGQGRYYAGYWASVFSPPTPPGATMAFILQSQQFTREDRGKTVLVTVQGYVNNDLFTFQKRIVIPEA